MYGINLVLFPICHFIPPTWKKSGLILSILQSFIAKIYMRAHRGYACLNACVRACAQTPLKSTWLEIVQSGLLLLCLRPMRQLIALLKWTVQIHHFQQNLFSIAKYRPSSKQAGKLGRLENHCPCLFSLSPLNKAGIVIVLLLRKAASVAQLIFRISSDYPQFCHFKCLLHFLWKSVAADSQNDLVFKGLGSHCLSKRFWGGVG